MTDRDQAGAHDNRTSAAPTDAGDGAPVVVAMKGIRRSFGDLLALDGVDFDLRRGEIHALLGENGAGKSTLMNVLYGLVSPDHGTIEVDGTPVEIDGPHAAIAHGIGMVHQHFKLVPRLTVAENIVLGDGGERWTRLPDLAEVSRRIEELSDRYGLEVPGDSYVWQLSVGQQQRAEILRALYHDARILILDEPTATLTPNEVEALLERLKGMAAAGSSIIIITHHLDEVMSSADRITVLRSGKYIATLKAAETSQSDLARLMVGRDLQEAALLEVQSGAAAGAGQHAQAGPPVLDVQNLTAYADPVGGPRRASSDDERVALEDITLQVSSGEIVAIAGVQGNGQAELEEVLLGLREVASGRIVLDGKDLAGATTSHVLDSGLGYIPSDRYRYGLISDLAISENLVIDRVDRAPYGSRFSRNFAAIRDNAISLIKSFSIAANSPKTPAATLSGGNAQKVILARSLRSDLSLLVAAQPTRGLDIGAIEFVWERLRRERDDGLGILLISTDLNEIMALAERCYVLYRGRLTESPMDRDSIGLAMGGANLTASGEVPV
ncbi:MAG: ABC transporter ATP-binding protein [Acidimicrobiia bacterium]|nr:ABC transporter ATP-binding protein [Acidimicrobiia bacterium]